MSYILKNLFQITLSIFFFSSCSKAPEEKIVEKEIEKAPKIAKHTVNVEKENFSISELLKLDTEVPIIELIIPVDWNQKDLDEVKKLEILSEVTFNGNDLSNLNIDFVIHKRTIKTLRFKEAKLNNELFKTLRRSVVDRIVFKQTDINELIIQSLKDIPRLKEVYSDNNLEGLKAALPEVEVKSL